MQDYGPAAAGGNGGVYSAGGSGNAQAQIKGTAVDSVNASIEALAGRVISLTNLARRISDGILGVEPPRPDTPGTGSGGLRSVTQSTQEQIKDLEAAFERLSLQINRLG